MGDQNKNVPRLRFPGYTDAWVKCELKDVAEIYDGTHQTPKYQSHGIMFLSVENITNLSSKKYISQEAFDSEFSIRPEKGDVLMTRIGDIGTANVVESEQPIAYYVSLALFKSTKLNPYFLKNSIHSPEMINDIWRRTLHIAFPKKINKNEIGNVSIYVPTIDEQTKIGYLFNSLDDLITVNERELNKLKDLKKSYLEKMFPKNGSDIPELRFPGYADAWVKCELGEVANYRNGRAHEQSISDDGEYVVINSKFVSTSGLVRKYSMVQNEPLRNGEIVFVLSDVPNGKALARTFLVTEDNKYTLNQRIAGITPFENIDSYFLYFLMNRHPYFTQFDDGVGQTNLSKNDVENFEESYPSGEEQAKIGEFFKHLDDLITVNEHKLFNSILSS